MNTFVEILRSLKRIKMEKEIDVVDRSYNRGVQAAIDVVEMHMNAYAQILEVEHGQK